MLHLINSAYVKMDIYIDRRDPHYNLSKYTGYQAVIESGNIIVDDESTQLGYETNLDNMSLNTFHKWMRTIRDHSGKLNIWVDMRSYVGLYTTYLYAMSPEMSDEDLELFLIMGKVRLMGTLTNVEGDVPPVKVNYDIMDNMDLIKSTAKRFAPVMREVLYSDPMKWSLEWRVLHYMKTGKNLGICKTLRNLTIRSLISVCTEALPELQCLLWDPKNWEDLGCTKETLLGSNLALSGLTTLMYLNTPGVARLGPNDPEVDTDFLRGLAEESIKVFDMTGEKHYRGAVQTQLAIYEKIVDKKHDVLEILQIMFGAEGYENRICDHDAVKYNTSMINHYLSGRANVKNTSIGFTGK